jgi:hypothetical protein
LPFRKDLLCETAMLMAMLIIRGWCRRSELPSYGPVFEYREANRRLLGTQA